MKINARNSPLFLRGRAKWESFVNQYQGPYDFAMSCYAGMNQKVAFGCPVHGEQCMDAKNLINGKTCKLCAFAARSGTTRFTTRTVVDRFIATHGSVYDYSNVAYKSQQVPVEILCYRHGAFLQKPEFHWSGSGCPQCFHEDRRGGAQRESFESFAAKVEAAFGGLFDLTGVVYTNSQTNIEVVCTKHKQVCTTRGNWLVNGNNPCTKCNHMKSNGEQEVARFLNIFTDVTQRDRTVLKPKELDIYLPDRRLAVEYCGDYWHSAGDADSAKILRTKHYDKHVACSALGIRLVTLYQSEWQQRKTVVKRLLRAAMGELKGRVHARKCQLGHPTTAEAAAFFENYHIQGGAGSGEHYGLYWGKKLVACMRFSFGSNDRGAGAAGRGWILSRYATRTNVVGGASRLFTAFLREHNPTSVKSFSDNRFFQGGMYPQLGFALDGELPPDYQVWSPKLGLMTKDKYQRRLLPKRLVEHGIVDQFDPASDPRSEADMTYAMGCRRIFDCGKRRWLWTNSLLTQ